MTVYSFHIFDRHCNCIYFREFPQGRSEEGTINVGNDSDASKLLFGIIFSLKNVCSKLAETDEKYNPLKSFSTSKYRVHVREYASGLRFAVVTDASVDNLQNVLEEIYSNFYVNNIALNPLSPIDFNAEERINNSKFIDETDNFLMSLPIYQ